MLYMLIISFEGKTSFTNNHANANSSDLFECNNELLSMIIAIECVGGAMHAFKSYVSFTGLYVRFIGNSAAHEGGAINLVSSELIFNCSKIIMFTNNNAHTGGAIYIKDNCIERFGSASFTSMAPTWWKNNTANKGGVIRAECAEITFQSITICHENSASLEGGVIYSSHSNISFLNITEFMNNSAINGGAMYIESSSLFILKLLNTSYNSAKQYGGVIYNKDAPTSMQCTAAEFDIYYNYEHNPLPDCSLQIVSFIVNSNHSYNNIIVVRTKIHSFMDTARLGGNFLYGGLLDRCRGYFERYINIESNSTKTLVTSKPYSLSLCNSSNSLSVHRGEVFRVYLQAIDQCGHPTTAQITASTSQTTSRLKLNESTQTLLDGCTRLTYKIYSNNGQEEMKFQLHGLCEEAGFDTNQTILYVTLLPCPDAFMLSDDECTCEKRLHQYNVTCTINTKFAIARNPGSTFWMGALYDNNSYQGLILYKTCPTDTGQKVEFPTVGY